jgi:transcriptional antiterminator RfaH
MENEDINSITLTTQEVANRLGISTSELSELRLTNDDLPIERQGFKLYYRLHHVQAFERSEAAKVIERVLTAERPLVLLRQMASVAGFSKLKIAGQQVQPLTVIQPLAAKQAASRDGIGTVDATSLSTAVMVDQSSSPSTATCLQSSTSRFRKTLDGTHPWYVVHTKTRQEMIALENLERQGYCCYLPQLKLKRPKARKMIVIEEPMFPRYLFIGADALFSKKGASFIRSTKGVHELVRFGSEPAQIRFELLQGIFDREQAQHSSPKEPFQTGDCVRVIDGPLAGLESIYQAQTGDERSMILLNLLSRPVQVQIATAQLRKST